MKWRWLFLERAFAPHILLAITVALTYGFGGPEYSFLKMVSIVVGLTVAWYWTDLAVTGRVQNRELIRFPKDPDGSTACLLLYIFAPFVCTLLSAYFGYGSRGEGASPSWLRGTIVFVMVDFGSLAIGLKASDAYSTFQLHVAPELQKAMAEQEDKVRGNRYDKQLWKQRQAARSEVQAFYDAHADALKGVFPPPLLRSFLSVSMHDGLEPTKVWEGCQDLITRLQPIIAREEERLRNEQRQQKHQQEESRKLQVRIETLEQQLDKLASSPLNRDVIEEEINAVQRQLRKLREEQNLQDTFTPSDL